MGYFLFILVNATLFLRPAELVPELAPYRIYETLILSCLALSLPQIIEYFFGRPLAEQPITFGVFALLPAVLLSHLANNATELAIDNTFEFAKVIVYYVLLVSVVNNVSRLRSFLFWVMVLSTLLTAVAVLRFYEVIDIKTPVTLKAGPGGVPMAQEGDDGAFVKEIIFDPDTGDETVVRRLRGTGIFQDPNDLSTVLVVGFLLALYWLCDSTSGLIRLAALGPLALFLLAFALTQSRGGFLCLVAGVATVLYARLGWRRTMGLTCLFVLPLLVLFAGRMTTLSATDGTGQARIQIWSDGLQMLRDAPLFGVGMDQFGVHVVKAAHNSFISCYAELGLFGGTIFLGLFYFALLTLYRIGRTEGGLDQPLLQRLQPFLMAVVVAYTVGIMSLSRSFVVPTYLVLGLVTVYSNICAGPATVPVVRFELRLAQRLAFLSALFLAGTYVFVRVFFRA